MKKLVLAAAITAAASTAFAGSMAEPAMEVEVMEPMVEEAAGTSGGLIIPLILVALIAAAGA